MGSANGLARPIDPGRDRVLVTGAAGLIGTALRAGLAPRWRHVRLTDRRSVPDPRPHEESIVADIGDTAALARAMDGVAALVHLAGAGGAYTLEQLFAVNARGLYDTFEAARHAGVRRIVFASSNHAHGCYPVTHRVAPSDPARPDTLYGVFKVLGETMLRYYFDRHAIRSVSLRIGTYRPEPIDQRSLATWLSPADMVQLVERSLLHVDPGCLVVNGYSANTHLQVSTEGWDTLGYRPVDDAERFREALRANGIDVDGPWQWPEHGGAFAREPEHQAR